MENKAIVNQNQSISIISEHTFPDKIKQLVWHPKMDIVAIICGNYFEIQRIGFKHEAIIKREENSEIRSIAFLATETLITVVLEDGTINYINISDGNFFN